MARWTHTGSATPVMAIGGFLPMQIDDAFRKKINNDATAFLRSFTERTRDATLRWRRMAITEGSAYTDEGSPGRENDLI